MQVLEIDIARAIPAFPANEGCDWARVLVRQRGRPLGWVQLEQVDGEFSAEALRRALVSELGAHVMCASPDDASTFESPSPPISVIVCTRDRAASLERCVQSLCALEYPEFEVIVVDNASVTDATRDVAARFNVRYVREDRPGLDWARNRGIAESRHELIAFTDDDVRVDSGWLHGIARGFSDPDVGAVTGMVAPMELATRAQVLFELHYGGMGKGVRPRVWDAAALAPTMAIACQHMGVGANMGFRRALLARIGGFDTALDVGTPAHGGGDLEMFHRVITSAAMLRYEPTAIVWHQHRREMRALRRQLYDNGRSFGVYLITMWRRSHIPRVATAWYSVGIWGRWLVARLVRGLLGRETLPVSLLWAELWGATHAPWAYFRTRIRARRTVDRQLQR
jgi:glycosyltransferase involved in cell wall biosynthesis